jgi:hypothetical protein
MVKTAFPGGLEDAVAGDIFVKGLEALREVWEKAGLQNPDRGLFIRCVAVDEISKLLWDVCA